MSSQGRYAISNASGIFLKNDHRSSRIRRLLQLQPRRSKPTMSSLSAVSVLVFGATALLTGICTLLFPTTMLSMLLLPDASLPALRANALAAIAMGIYYTLAFVQDNRAFFVATVPMRILTAVVLGLQGGPWMYVALWEGYGAYFTGVVLALEDRDGNEITRENNEG